MLLETPASSMAPKDIQGFDVAHVLISAASPITSTTFLMMTFGSKNKSTGRKIVMQCFVPLMTL